MIAIPGEFVSLHKEFGVKMENDLFYKSILDNLFDGVYIVNGERQIVYWNRGAENISGFSYQKVIGTHCHDNLLMHVDKEGLQLCHNGCPLAKTLQDGKNREMVAFLHHAEGYRVPVQIRVSPIMAEDGTITGAIEIFTDNSSQLVALQKITELEKEVYLDPLTKIGNRRYLQQKLEAALDDFQKNNASAGILLADIDYFKRINENYGHPVGDQVLKVVANTLSHNLRPYDLIGRWGGEEFLLLLSIDSAVELANTANRLRLLVQQSGIMVEGKMVRVTISMGGTITRPGDTPETSIARADQQRYAGKHAGRNCIRID